MTHTKILSKCLLLLVVIASSLMAFPAWSQVGFSIESPSGSVGDDLFVKVIISPLETELESVTAQVDNTNILINLQKNESGWVGRASLKALPKGSMTVTITETDKKGLVSTRSQEFYKNADPVVKIIEGPEHGRVYRQLPSTVRIKATCTDDAPDAPNDCENFELYIPLGSSNHIIIPSINGTMDQEVAIPASELSTLKFEFRVKIRINPLRQALKTLETLQLHVNSHPLLVEDDYIPGFIIL